MAFAGTWGFYIASLSNDRGIPLLQAGFILALASFLAIPFALVGGFLGDRLPIRRVLFGFAVVLASAMLTTAFAHTLPFFLVSAALFGIGSGALTILPLAAVVTYFGRRNLGTVLGCYLCIVNLTSFLSYALIGSFFDAFGDWTVLLLWLVSLVGALAYLLMGEPRTVPVTTPGRQGGEPTF